MAVEVEVQWDVGESMHIVDVAGGGGGGTCRWRWSR